MTRGEINTRDLDNWITGHYGADQQLGEECECGGDCGEMSVFDGEPCANPLDYCSNCPAVDGRHPKLTYDETEYVYVCPTCGEVYPEIETCGFVNGGAE